MKGFNSHCVDRRKLNRFMFLVSSPEHGLGLVPKMFDELDCTDSMPPPTGFPHLIPQLTMVSKTPDLSPPYLYHFPVP